MKLPGYLFLRQVTVFGA